LRIIEGLAFVKTIGLAANNCRRTGIRLRYRTFSISAANTFSAFRSTPGPRRLLRNCAPWRPRTTDPGSTFSAGSRTMPSVARFTKQKMLESRLGRLENHRAHVIESEAFIRVVLGLRGGTTAFQESRKLSYIGFEAGSFTKHAGPVLHQ